MTINIASIDLSREDRFHCERLVVVDARRTLEVHLLGAQACDLYNRSVLAQATQ